MYLSFETDFGMEIKESYKVKKGDTVFYIDFNEYKVKESTCSDECYTSFDGGMSSGYILLEDKTLIPWEQSVYLDYESARQDLQRHMKKKLKELETNIERLEDERRDLTDIYLTGDY